MLTLVKLIINASAHSLTLANNASNANQVLSRQPIPINTQSVVLILLAVGVEKCVTIMENVSSSMESLADAIAMSSMLASSVRGVRTVLNSIPIALL